MMKTLTFYEVKKKKSLGFNDLLSGCSKHFPDCPTSGKQILKGQDYLNSCALSSGSQMVGSGSTRMGLGSNKLGLGPASLLSTSKSGLNH